VLTKLFVSLCLFGLTADAVTIQFVNVGSGDNNAVAYVGPYNLLVNGVLTQGTCISPFLEVDPPYQWTANVDPIADFADPQYTQLLQAAWLVGQFAASSDQIGIQQAVWNLFGAAYTDTDTLSWGAAAVSGYLSVNPSNFSVLVPVPADFTQSFLIESGVSGIESSVPEPALWWIVAAALVVFWRGDAGNGRFDPRRFRRAHFIPGAVSQ
jgi:hypothetical protein